VDQVEASDRYAKTMPTSSISRFVKYLSTFPPGETAMTLLNPTAPKDHPRRPEMACDRV